MKSPITGALMAVAALGLVAGCGSTTSSSPGSTGAGAPPNAATAPGPTSMAPDHSTAPGQTMASGETMAPDHSMPPGQTMAPGETMAADPAADDKVPEEALMVCGPEIQESIKTILRLPSNPAGASTWKNKLFQCTYALKEGTLVLRVKESADDDAARVYFDSRRAIAKNTSTLKGIASLGLPAYQTSDGVASFVRDNMTLEVDATAMNATVGAEGTTKGQFAYTIATNVLACWTESH